MPRARGLLYSIVAVALLSGCNDRKPAPADEPNDTTDVNGANGGTAVKQPDQTNPPPRMATTSELRFRLASTGLPEESRWKCDPALADVNGDGHIDLAAHPRLERGPVIWFGDGAGNWTKAPTQPEFGQLSCGGNLHLVDVNHDNHLDLVVADHCSGIYVWLGDGQGGWTRAAGPINASDQMPRAPESDDNVPTGFEDVAVGDINGDTHVDFVAGGTDSDAGFSVFLGDGSGARWKLSKTSLPDRGWVTRVRLADMNSDGRLDVVSSWFEGPCVWLGDGAGDFKEASQGLPRTENAGIFHGLGIADFNSDGRTDLAVMNWYNGVLVYYQTEAGHWFFPEDPFPLMRGGGYGMMAGDINGDGHADLLVGGRLTTELGNNYGAFVLLGDGRGHYRYVADSGIPETGMEFNFGVNLGDVNGDGLLDVVVGSGGDVATGPSGPQPPVIAPRLAVWLTERRE